MRGGGLLELRERDECVLMDGVRLGLDRAGLELERLALKLLPPELRPALEERPPDDRPPPVAALPIDRDLLFFDYLLDLFLLRRERISDTNVS